MIATLTALWLRVDSSPLNAGLYGYNGVLVGLALATFVAPGALLWAYVILGAAVSVAATLGTANALEPFGVAALTFPFVLVTWILLLATYGFFNTTTSMGRLTLNMLPFFVQFERGIKASESATRSQRRNGRASG